MISLFKDRFRDSYAEFKSCLEIDHKGVFSCFDRDRFRGGPFKQFVSKARGLFTEADVMFAICHKYTASLP